MSASPWSNPQTYGFAGGVLIAGNCIAGSLDVKTTVTLNVYYVRFPPPGYPRPDPSAPIETSLYAFPQIIPAGSVLTLFSDEAAALVAAGAAT